MADKVITDKYVLSKRFSWLWSNPPHPQWPEDAKIALQIVLNYEEGSEYSIPDWDEHCFNDVLHILVKLIYRLTNYLSPKKLNFLSSYEPIIWRVSLIHYWRSPMKRFCHSRRI
ncbi:MAG: hypothetical protein QNJ41_01365 [Xenococcaceae cyanobacterium MO_188.B32]|nr:hypothetical protein [Xenococcaceae cyanobacterium MO_188.B32]